MGSKRKNGEPRQQPRRDQMYEPQIQDPYQAHGKPPEPALCGDCGAVFHKGRWQWATAPEGAHDHLCPACSRTRDKAPAARLTLSGEFYRDHRDEIMNLVHNAEAKEKPEHPLERIMAMEDLPDAAGVIISYTGIHLAKSTGEALHRAYEGQFDFEYVERDSILRLSWER